MLAQHAPPPAASAMNVLAPSRPSSAASSADTSDGEVIASLSRSIPGAPMLVLEPLNGTFATKTLDVSAGPIKVGRKMNSKHASERTNGIFDSKVLSRSHAEIWYEDGKVLIRDVGSSNGTYLNGVRLSEEGKPGKPCEIVSGDEIVFGIDIATDEQMTGTFQKVACLARLMDPADIKMPIPSPAREYNSNRLSDSHRFGGLRLDNILNILDDEIRRATTANLEIEQLKVTLADLDSIVNSNPPSSRDDGIFVPNRQQLQNGAEKSQRSATAVESAKPERTGTVLPDIMTIENERRSHKEALEVMEARVRAAVDEAQQAKTEQQKAVHQLEAELDGMKGNLASTVERCRELETKIAQLETEKACGETSFSNDLEAWRVRALKAEGDLEHFKQQEISTMKATAAATQAQKEHLEGLEREIVRLKTEQTNQRREAAKDTSAAAARHQAAINEMRVESAAAQRSAIAKAVKEAVKEAEAAAAAEWRSKVDTLERKLDVAETEKAALKVRVKGLEDSLAAANANLLSQSLEKGRRLSSDASQLGGSAPESSMEKSSRSPLVPSSPSASSSVVSSSAATSPNSSFSAGGNGAGLRHRRSKAEIKAERNAAAKAKRAMTAVEGGKAPPEQSVPPPPATGSNGDGSPTQTVLVQAVLYLGFIGFAAVSTYLLFGR